MKTIPTTTKSLEPYKKAGTRLGQVPRADSNNVWETYKHHVERFYDFLHLDRALREKDFKHNYEEKLKLIERAESFGRSSRRSSCHS